MRRLLLSALAAIALFPALAHTKALVVYDRYDIGDGTRKDWLWMQERMTHGFLDLMNHTNANYTLVPFSAMKTEWVRNGQLVSGWNPATATAARTENYDCVIFLAFKSARANAALKPMPQGMGPTRVDSLMRFNRLPLVPIAFLYGANAGSSGLSGSAPFVAQSTCSTGVKAAGTPFAYPQLIYCTDTGKSWLGAANQPGFDEGGLTANNSCVIDPTVAGGVRTLLAARQSFYGLVTKATATNNFDCNSCDSTYGNQSSPDTAIAWERTLVGRSNDGQAANTRIVFANLMGASPCSAPSANVSCEFDEPTAMYILAHLDSLTGGKIWDKPTGIKTLLASATIDAAFSRGGRRFAGGIVPSDSAVFIASLDSLSTLGIPITVGVNVDSMATYASEKTWWPRLGSRVRYSPQAWAGLKLSEDGTHDSTRAIASSTTAPADVFGRYRLRTAMGVVGDTTSIYAGLVNSRSIVASYFPGRISGLCMAPLDDYSPKNLNWSTGPGPDSLLYVISLAGFTCLRTDVQARDANPFRMVIGANKDLVRGWWPNQRQQYSPILRGYFPILGQTGFSISGSKYSYIPTDSIVGGGAFGGPAPGPAAIPQQTVGRFWHGFAHDRFEDPDWWMIGVDAVDINNGGHSFLNVIWAAEDFSSPFNHASILKMHASDFGGIPNGPPKRPGWWALKSIKNQFDAINKAAGRNVCAFVWPEDITP